MSNPSGPTLRTHAQLRRTWLKVNGVTLHVVEAGPLDGPLVVLLHGFPEGWSGWRHQIGALAQAGYRVLVPDQRGYSLSDKPTSVRAYQIDTLARDVIGLLDARGRDTAFVVGHDWGGEVAWTLGLNHPDRVRRLVILNVPHPDVFLHTLRTNWTQMRRSWYMFFFQLPVLPEVLLRARNFQLLAVNLTDTSRPGTFSEEDLEEYRDGWRQPGALTGMLNWYRAMFRAPGKRPDHARVQVPTLILWGADDQFLVTDMAEQSLRCGEDIELELFEGMSHWIQHEEPEVVNARLLAFFARDGTVG